MQRLYNMEYNRLFSTEFGITWYHNIALLDKLKSQNERLEFQVLFWRYLLVNDVQRCFCSGADLKKPLPVKPQSTVELVPSVPLFGAY